MGQFASSSAERVIDAVQGLAAFSSCSCSDLGTKPLARRGLSFGPHEWAARTEPSPQGCDSIWETEKNIWHQESSRHIMPHDPFSQGWKDPCEHLFLRPMPSLS